MADTTVGSFLRAGKGRKGTFTVNGTTPVVVNDKRVVLDTVISQSLRTVSGTPGMRVLSNVTPGTGFTVVGTAGDLSTYNYILQ